MYHVHDVLPPDEILFPYFLREEGYDTALFGKLHVAGHMWEMKYRYQWDGFNTYEWAPDPNGYHGCETAMGLGMFVLRLISLLGLPTEPSTTYTRCKEPTNPFSVV